MAVTIDDVRHIATLARLGVSDDQAAALAVDLNGILSHMDVLAQVDTTGVSPSSGVGSGGTPLRADGGDSVPLLIPHESMAPEMKDGFFIVPRLSTHEAVEGGA